MKPVLLVIMLVQLSACSDAEVTNCEDSFFSETGGSHRRAMFTIISETGPRQEGYKRCLTEKTVELGAGNSESAETILRAVAAVCLSAETALRELYAETPLSRAHVEGFMHRDKKLGEDAGVAALLVSRADR